LQLRLRLQRAMGEQRIERKEKAISHKHTIESRETRNEKENDGSNNTGIKTCSWPVCAE
jgi:hypothetical protein